MNLETKEHYRLRIANISECASGRCNHGCNHVIQLVNSKTSHLELEVCEIDAERIAGLLLNAVETSAKSVS